MLLRLDALEKRIGPRRLFAGVSAAIGAGDRIGVVGPNGAGKTTLLHAIAGEEPLDGGTVQRVRDARVGLLRQEIDPRSERSVRDEARSALAELDGLEDTLRRLEGEMGEAGGAVPEALATRYDAVALRFEQGGGFARHARVAGTLAGLGFREAEQDRPLHTFSGGWLMRVELAKLLLAQPDVLLLDEPTNHLDLPSIQFFESAIADFPGAVVVVSHDRTFLRRHANRIFELDGRGGFALYEGDYDRFLAQREARAAEQLARKVNQDRVIAEQERFIERFRAKASKARQAQSRIKALERMERIEAPDDARRTVRLALPTPPRSGERVLSLEGIHKRYDDAPVYDGIDFALHRGEKVALAGPNGAGKSTLLRIAAGVTPIDAGERRLGHAVELAFFAQHQLEALDASHTVFEAVAADALPDDLPRIRGLLGALLFSGDDVEKRIEVLSGGEKARVALAKLLLRPANLLILDEPTNHLDVESCEVLEEALSGFAGTILFVSHDRAFIDALATRVVEVEAGRLESHVGTYTEYLERKQRRGEDEPAGPARATRLGDAATDANATSPTDGTTNTPPTDKAARLAERERRKERDRIARRVERLEARIAEDEERKAAIHARLAEPEVYADPDQVRSVQAEEAACDAELEAAYAEWERLSEALSDLADA